MKKLKNKIVERRRATRFKPLLRVKYKFKKRAAWRKQAFISDISGTGMKIYTSEPLEKNKDIMILAKDNQELSMTEILCAVRWSRKLEKNKFEAGLEFKKKIKGDKPFIDWVSENLLNIGFYPE